MERRLKNYIAYMESLVNNEMSEEERERARRELLTNISFFQHERLVHLLVTLAFTFLLAFAIWGCVTIGQISFFIFFFLVLVLLIPYIRHYYILENGTQRLYRCYDLLMQESWNR